MRIVFITSKLRFEKDGSPIGGSVIDLHLKAKELAELGYEVSVVTAFSDADRIIGGLPYKVFERCIKHRGLFSLQKGVYSFLKEFENMADVFYIDGHMFLYGGGAYRIFGGKVPVVGFFNIRLNAWADTSGNRVRTPIYLRAKKFFRTALERVFGAPIANHLDAFIFNTPQVQKLYHRFGIGRRKLNAVIEDFVPTRELMQKFLITPEKVAEHQHGVTTITFLSTGRMLPEKGFELLIHAFAKVRDRRKYNLILSGDGPDKEWLQKLAQDMGLGEVVKFTGWVEKENLNRFFSEANVFVFPRWWIEYGSAVLTEALAFGLPSIIPGGGALEWLARGAALTFENENIDELAEQIDELGTDVKLRVALSLKALARAKELDARILAKKLEHVLTLV